MNPDRFSRWNFFSWNCNALQVSPTIVSCNTVGFVKPFQEVSRNSFTKSSEQHLTARCWQFHVTAPNVSVAMRCNRIMAEISSNKFHEKVSPRNNRLLGKIRWVWIWFRNCTSHFCHHSQPVWHFHIARSWSKGKHRRVTKLRPFWNQVFKQDAKKRVREQPLLPSNERSTWARHPSLGRPQSSWLLSTGTSSILETSSKTSWIPSPAAGRSGRNVPPLYKDTSWHW